MKRLVVLSFLTILAGAVFAQQEQQNASFYKKQGSEAFKAKDFSGAYNAFVKAIELGKQNGNLDTTLYYNTAVAAYRSRNIEESVNYFGKCTEFGVHPERAYLFKYQLEKKLEKKAQADSTLKKAYQEFPDNNKISYYYNYDHGVKLYRKGAERIKQVSDLKDSEKEKDINKYNKEVDKANETFSEALSYLEKAYETKATKKVAKILSNVYSNLGMKDKAQEMQAKLE